MIGSTMQIHQQDADLPEMKNIRLSHMTFRLATAK